MTFLIRIRPAISLSSYSSHPIFIQFQVIMQNIKDTTSVSLKKTFISLLTRQPKSEHSDLKHAKSLLSVTLPFAMPHSSLWLISVGMLESNRLNFFLNWFRFLIDLIVISFRNFCSEPSLIILDGWLVISYTPNINYPSFRVLASLDTVEQKRQRVNQHSVHTHAAPSPK